MSPRPRLLIVERPATRHGIRLALGDLVEVCAEAETAEQAIRAAKDAQPDLCVLGGSAPDGALAALRGVCRAAPAAAVVLLSEEPDVEHLLDAIRAGAVGYLPGALDVALMRRMVAALAAGQAIIPRGMILELFLELRNGRAGGSGLSAREAEVLGLLRRGHTTLEIARRLEIAPVTVRRHISELVRELGVSSRADLLDTVGARPTARGSLAAGVQSS